ncbi:MAG TPA: Cu(I)-responsive transcriptional regulator [Lysobacter sp.]|nr:Cu(I)-responsive transcriptional regulator [Lysobacter sp.]
MAKSAPKPELADARADGLHNIGQAAALTGVSTKMIRHYEAIGLLPAVARTQAGYRIYDETALHRLRFIHRARSLGFPIRQIDSLLALWDDRSRASGEVKQLALAHAAELAKKVEEMQAMQRTLEQLARRCQGGDRPDCPILDDLAGDPGLSHGDSFRS